MQLKRIRHSGITVLANYGNDLDEVYVTARNPGIEFSTTVSTDSSMPTSTRRLLGG